MIRSNYLVAPDIRTAEYFKKKEDGYNTNKLPSPYNNLSVLENNKNISSRKKVLAITNKKDYFSRIQTNKQKYKYT